MKTVDRARHALLEIIKDSSGLAQQSCFIAVLHALEIIAWDQARAEHPLNPRWWEEAAQAMAKVKRHLDGWSPTEGPTGPTRDP